MKTFKTQPPVLRGLACWWGKGGTDSGLECGAFEGGSWGDPHLAALAVDCTGGLGHDRLSRSQLLTGAIKQQEQGSLQLPYLPLLEIPWSHTV